MDAAQNLFKGDLKMNKKGKMVEGKPFVLHHCWHELKMNKNGGIMMDWKWKRKQ
jgi:hypothetical protein